MFYGLILIVARYVCKIYFFKFKNYFRMIVHAVISEFILTNLLVIIVIHINIRGLESSRYGY